MIKKTGELEFINHENINFIINLKLNSKNEKIIDLKEKSFFKINVFENEIK